MNADLLVKKAPWPILSWRRCCPETSGLPPGFLRYAAKLSFEGQASPAQINLIKACHHH